jgi:hypothetical protein
MGKVFITDEVNDGYTANVTNAGKLEVQDAANLYYSIATAQTTISAQSVTTTPCYLRSITLSYPTTAATLIIYNNSASAGNVSGFGTSGDNVVTRISFPIGHASALSGGGQTPITIPLDVYLSSGLAIGNGGHSANDSLGYVGVFRGGIITYQT